MIAAIEYYKKVLEIEPSFGMTLGQLGKAYQFYADWTSDSGNKLHLHHCAYDLLTKGLTYPQFHFLSSPFGGTQSIGLFCVVYKTTFSTPFIGRFLHQKSCLAFFA